MATNFQLECNNSKSLFDHNEQYCFLIIVCSLIIMRKIACKDYGFECDFISQGNDVDKVISEYATHSTQEHGIEYSVETLIQVLNRMKK